MISTKLIDRLKEVFTEVSSGLVAARVTDLAGILGGIQYDYVSLTYTDSTKENLSSAVFKTGGASGDTVATITIAYPTASTETYTRT